MPVTLGVVAAIIAGAAGWQALRPVSSSVRELVAVPGFESLSQERETEEVPTVLAATPGAELGSGGSTFDPKELDLVFLDVGFDAQLTEVQVGELAGALLPGFRSGRRYAYRSMEPIGEGRTGPPFLSLRLTILEYEDATGGERAWAALFDSADPDTGLSYEWARVSAVGAALYWLSAPCLVSESNWEQLSAQIPSSTRSFSCRCGGGCTKPE